MILQFDVINQRIIRKDNNYIVANSQFYLQIDFNFTQDWRGFGKTITFVSGTKKYSIGLNAQDSCVVPWEVIKIPSFLFSIRGELDDVVITTNIVTVPINASGETHGIAPSDPPKEIFSGLQNGLKGQALYKLTDDNYDYGWGNLKEMSYDDTSTLGEVLDNLVIDAVTDVKYEDGFLKKVENNITTTIVEMYDKATIDEMLENLDKYIEKSETPGLIKNDGSIDETIYASQNDLNNAKNDLQNQINNKQNTLTAGNNIQINNNTISATDTTYTAGNGLTLTGTTFSVDTTIIATKQDVSNEADARQQAITGLDNAKQDKLSQDQLNAVNSGITQAKREGYDNHITNEQNPHNVSKSQVGLGNVANTGDSNTPVENGTEKFTTGGAYTLKTDLENKINNIARTYTNVTVLTSAFEQDATYEDFPYKAVVVEDNYLIGKVVKSCYLVFNMADSISGNYASIFNIDEVTGEITIYAKEIPQETLVISSIVIIF